MGARNIAYLCSLSTGWRNWWDLVGQHLCHVCTTQSSHQQQTAGERKNERRRKQLRMQLRERICSMLQTDSGYMQLPAWHSCPASPPQTTSCFPCHFPDGGHLSGQLLSLLCLSRPHPFSPSSHPGTEKFMQWLNRLNTLSTLTTESFKKKNTNIWRRREFPLPFL